MAVAPISKLLDQLMGPNRNKLSATKKLKRHWSDKDVCKYHLAAFCPNELFENTKADIGSCPDRHADVLRDQYQKSDRYGVMGYEEELVNYLDRLLHDCDRKIEKARARLENNKEKNKDARGRAEIERQAFLTTKIEHLLAKVEALGNQGNVVEAKEVSEVIDKLRIEKANEADASFLARSDMAMEREMDVCEVCSALILVGDTQLRIEDHILGRQHAGYAKLREQQALMQTKYWKKEQKPPVKPGEVDKSAENPEEVTKKDDKSPSRRRKRSRSRESSPRKSRKSRREDSADRHKRKSRESGRDRSPETSRRREKRRDRSRERSRDRKSRKSERRSRKGSDE